MQPLTQQNTQPDTVFGAGEDNTINEIETGEQELFGRFAQCLGLIALAVYLGYLCLHSL